MLGYDGTPAAVAALRWVADRAARQVAVVHVVTVLSRFARDRAAALSRLGDAEAYLRERAPGVGVELHRLESPTQEALAAAAGTGMLVVGASAGRPLGPVMAGALARRRGATEPGPLILVPPGWVDAAMPVSVGIAADGSSEAALTFAAQEADRGGVAVRLVHARPGRSAGRSTEDGDRALAEGRRILQAAAGRLREQRLVADIRQELVRETPVSALLRYGARSSMIVVGSHLRGIVGGVFLGSVSQELARRTPCPLAVVAPHRERKEDHS